MLRIATWNINSVRLRIGMVCRFLAEAKPDVLCLQEIKCRDGEFPAKAFKEAGYKHMHVVGQKGWHGVAIVSRVKLEPVEAPAICHKKEARIAAALIDGVEVHNLYVPAGADVPELTNPKFVHKLSVLDKMKTLYKKRKGKTPTVLVGDLNVAPGEFDVWSHKQLLNVVSHTPGETDRLNAVRDLGGFVDLARVHKPDPEKLSQPRLDEEQSRAPPRSHLGDERHRSHVECRSVSYSRAVPLMGAAERSRARCRWT
jgi:exodeoxyribonuclease-3